LLNEYKSPLQRIFMGVSLSALVKGEEIDFEYLKHKKIGIDAYNTLYQFISIIRDRFTGEPLRDSKGRVTSHLSGIFYRVSKMLEVGIQPIFIFDGKPPEFKRRTQEDRSRVRREAEEKWKAALEKGDTEKVRLYSQGASRLTAEMIADAKQLLDYMGIPWVQAPSEGEAQAAYFVNKGDVWASGSQDWDSLLFGAKRMVKNLAISGRRKVPRKEKYIEVKPEIIRVEDVLKDLGIGQDQLITLGILIGTDYNPGGVKGIGPKTALKLVKEEKTLEKVMEKVEWNFDITPEKIFNFFKTPPAEDIEIKGSSFSPEKTLEFLSEEHDFSRERIESTIKKLEKSKGEQKQTGLGKFIG
jgi:flap endonuclease-1